jgi:hypothetical protein
MRDLALFSSRQLVPVLVLPHPRLIHQAVKLGILIAIDRIAPFAADERGVEQEVDFLRVEPRLSVLVPVPLDGGLIVDDWGRSARHQYENTSIAREARDGDDPLISFTWQLRDLSLAFKGWFWSLPVYQYQRRFFRADAGRREYMSDTTIWFVPP